MSTLRVYTRTVAGSAEIEQEVEINDTLTYSERIKIIKLVLGVEDDEDRD